MFKSSKSTVKNKGFAILTVNSSPSCFYCYTCKYFARCVKFGYVLGYHTNYVLIH